MTRRLLTATAAATLVLGLAACGDKTDGTITDPPATVAVDTSDNGGDQPSDGGGAGASDGGGSTEAAPDIPAPDPADYPGMDEQTDEGAEQAFKFYFDTAFWAFQTGDVDELKKMTNADCSSCLSLIGSIEENNQTGKYWSKTSVEEKMLSSEPSKNYDIDVTYGVLLGAHTEPDPKTGEDIDNPASVVAMTGGVSWIDGRWQIGDMALQTEEV